MSFFDGFARAEPAPEPAQPPPPRWLKPEEVLGGSVAAEFLLARGEGAAVGLGGIVGYPEGFTFAVTAVLREEDRHGRLYHEAFHHDLGGAGPVPPGFLRVGVLFADGKAVSNVGGHPDLPWDAEPPGPLLMSDRGGGGGRRYGMSYWVWPLPPEGPVTFVCEWPARGIGESRVEIDAALIREAAGRAIELGQ
ncbi:hypothetical protein [Actinoplanes sp. NPDC023714]|uniref:hypothetical protein n=1 Tax=Actinoplanes sp. NPDC023714 TaxID=3154322 RepID=UPI003404CB98